MNKKGVVLDYLPWIIIAVILLVLLMVAIFLLKDKGITVIENIKNIITGR